MWNAVGFVCYYFWFFKSQFDIISDEIFACLHEDNTNELLVLIA